MKILIINNDQHQINMIAGLLQTVGHQVRCANESTWAQAVWREFQPTLVITNEEYLTRVIDMQYQHDALVLVTLEQGKREEHALNNGADSIIHVPFTARQLLAHINSLSRRVRQTLVYTPTSITVGNITIHPALLEAHRNGERIRLTPNECKLLHILMANAGQKLTFQQIADHIWGHTEGDSKQIKGIVRSLRLKIEPNPSQPCYIININSHGYMFAKEG